VVAENNNRKKFGGVIDEFSQLNLVTVLTCESFQKAGFLFDMI